MSYKIISGSIKEVEDKINNLEETWNINVNGLTSTEDKLTVILKIKNLKN